MSEEFELPSNEDLEKAKDYLEMVMASRYRVMVHHEGIEFENPFEEETKSDSVDRS